MRSLLSVGAVRRTGLTVLAVLLLCGGAAYLAMPKLAATVVRAQGVQQNASTIQDVRKRALGQPGYDMLQAKSIAVPRLHIQLDIMPGYYSATSQSWTLDRTHAFLMETRTGALATATPVVYGHNIPAVFAKLDGIAPHEVVVITQADGRQLYFEYQSERVVAPMDSAWLHEPVRNGLYVTTCTGAWFQSRRVILFQFVGATPPAGQPTEGR